LLTPIARVVAVKVGAVAKPRDRDVHTEVRPRMGGVAICAGFAVAIGLAREMPTLRTAFGSGPNFAWIVAAAIGLCALGVVDDRFNLDAPTKLAGQVTAAGVMVIKGGVQMAFVHVPGMGTISLGADLGVPLTILLTVVLINALNFIDGLDGLAAGMSVISSAAFFVFCYHLATVGITDVWAAPTLMTAALGGACLGFLPHNFWPAKVFMGDSGSMVIGLLLAAAATTTTTSLNPESLGMTGSFALLLPLLIPLAVMAVPFVDFALAVVRRMSRLQSPFAADKDHLHHMLLRMGHSHRRTVLLLYYWSVLLSFAGVAVGISTKAWPVEVAVGALVIVGVLLLAEPRLRRGRRPRRDRAARDEPRPPLEPAAARRVEPDDARLWESAETSHWQAAADHCGAVVRKATESATPTKPNKPTNPNKPTKPTKPSEWSEPAGSGEHRMGSGR